MLDSRISFKNRWLAGILAFLIPGAGHIYQGRWFKGILCAVCILGTFLYGMELGDWSVVYWKQDPTNLLNSYYAQFFVGLPALPSLLQSRRYTSRENSEETHLEAPLTAPFRDGILKIDDRTAGIPDGKIEGTISLEPYNDPVNGTSVRGTFTGTLTTANGKTIPNLSLKLGRAVQIAKPVSADPDRELSCYVIGAKEEMPEIGHIRGSIPRSFWHRFEAPPDEDYYLELHRRLGKFHELAMTFTMIAGLLNILVILDAVEGPAYGYGDAEPRVEEKKEPTSAAAGPPDHEAVSTPTKAAATIAKP